jgi:MerR family transcriptional regulator, redox-sensitive transcriptional activator SoxR
MSQSKDYLSIGEVARRSGVAPSALRFYETRGLIHSVRAGSNHRRYHRATLRRISIIRVAQTLGLSLQEIASAFASLPRDRAPTKRDWARLSSRWGEQLDRRIADLQNLRDRLDGCIGCGCLSMKHCALNNPGDTAASSGSGPRYLLDNVPDDD